AYPAPTGIDPGLDPASAPFVVVAPEPGGEPAPAPADQRAGPERIGDGRGLAGPVAFTADATALIVVGRTDTDPGISRLLRIPLDGGPTLDLTAGLDRNVMSGGSGYPGALPQLADGGATVVFCARDRGCTHLYRVATDGSAPPAKLMGGPDRVASGVAVDPKADLLVAVVATPQSAGELVILDRGEERALTALTAEALPGVEPVAPSGRVFTAPDGTPVHAFVLAGAGPGAGAGTDAGQARAAPGPLLLDVHGGPHNAWSPVLDPAHLYHHELVAAGWTVLLVNPRGSDGYGEEQYTAVVGGWGTADRPDFTTALDTLVAEGVADPDRLAVSGYSYGGYTTCWLTTQTDRFAAAVAGGCVSDLRSVAGTSDVGHFLGAMEVGALPWEDGGRYDASSPLAHAGRVSTPTLLLHGEDDMRCPVGQAEQWFSMLRARGVPTRMVRYPGASHLFILEGRPSHREHYARELVAWLDRYVAGAERPEPVRPDGHQDDYVAEGGDQ
ncbi:MAG: alpha/beta hydrolase family protein, partial [Acidimicrobiales bacterium]